MKTSLDLLIESPSTVRKNFWPHVWTTTMRKSFERNLYTCVGGDVFQPDLASIPEGEQSATTTPRVASAHTPRASSGANTPRTPIAPKYADSLSPGSPPPAPRALATTPPITPERDETIRRLLGENVWQGIRLATEIASGFFIPEQKSNQGLQTRNTGEQDVVFPSCIMPRLR